MSLSALSMKYRTVVLTIVSLLMLWGIVSVMTMPRREDPEYTVRVCAVTTAWPGASTIKMEELITKPLEEAYDKIPEVKEVYSTTTNGLSVVYVETEDFVSPEQIDNVWDKVRARTQKVNMPEPGIVPVVNDEFGDTFILLLAVSQKPLDGENEIRENHRYSLRQLDLFSERIKDELRLIPSVSKSEQYGVVEEAIYVETDLATWSQLKLTSSQLEQLVKARNIVESGGAIDTEVGRFNVKPGGELNAVTELDSIVVDMAGETAHKRPVFLKDLGLTIKRDYKDPKDIICRYGNHDTSRPSVIVAISMKSGGNIVDVCEQAKKRVKEMQEVDLTLPPDLSIIPISDQSQNVNRKIKDVVSNVIGAIVIVVVVVYLIVGMRSAIVMAANIPVVVMAAIAMITLFDVQLEQISLASIIIALGLLVDNAVQISSQARVNQLNGMTSTDAAIEGASMVASPMLMGTLTTVAAFAPMLFALEGSTQEYIYSLPVTLSVTLGISWILAMSFCTILSAAFIRIPKDPSKPSAPLPQLWAFLQKKIRRGKQTEVKESFFGNLFQLSVRTAINFKFMTVGISIVLLILAIQLPIASEFFPKDVRDQFGIKIWLPENSTIEQTNKVAQQVEEILQKLSPLTDSEGQPIVDKNGEPIQQLLAMRTMVGSGGSRWYMSWDQESRRAYFAEILVRTTDGKYTTHLASQLRLLSEEGGIIKQGEKEIKIDPIIGARVIPQILNLGPSKDPVEIRVYGSGFADIGQLRGYADRVKKIIADAPGTWDVNDSWGVSGYQLNVDVDEAKANLAGVTNVNIANTLNAYYSGQYLTTFREGDHLVPVYLRLRPDERKSLDDLQSAFVEGYNGKVPLDSIATTTPQWEPATIRRRFLNRVIEVRSQVEPGVMGNDVAKTIMASDEIKQIQKEMPGNFWIEVGGNLKESARGAKQLSISLAISLFSIILLLIIQYNGWAKPIIILATLPLALIGALPGLYFTGNPLGFMPQLGILSLFGIVLNTGIIFIEFADILIKDAIEKSDGKGPIYGLTKEEFRSCLTSACQQRLLPIFLTTSTTIGGLLPLAISGGPLWEGMAWCMIFGLTIATLLTLLVVPAMYAIVVETFKVRPVELDR